MLSYVLHLKLFGIAVLYKLHGLFRASHTSISRNEVLQKVELIVKIFLTNYFHMIQILHFKGTKISI